jgi:feruloyl esterase
MARLPNVTAAIQTATHCRVSINLRPTADSEIKSEVWLPATSVWNGKLLMEGGCGLVGSINTGGMTHAVGEGYASASTDTGHTGSSGRFALDHPDKITDFAYALFTKPLVRPKH